MGKSTELPSPGMYSPEYTCIFKFQLMQLSLLSFHLSKCSDCSRSIVVKFNIAQLFIKTLDSLHVHLVIS